MNEDDEDIDEDEDDEEVKNLNTTAIKCFTLMNGIGIHTFLIILEQVNYEFDPQLLPKKSFDILIETLALASYWLVFLAKKRPGYPGREYILQLGTDPKAKDDDVQIPFYVMAGRRVAYRDGNSPIFRALVHAAGSHLDTAEMNGDTVLNLLKRNLAGFRGSADGVDVEVDAYFSSLLNAVLPLTCCCARVIRRRSDFSYSPAIRLSSQR
ncbi:hypothetical protein DAPPUDRAFT_114167 [Daphnia pulex]|uniref:Uncharacterized protein n=1 Tax=Daphnia pulex TaxID=6669 RepID=E9HH86_DAPPU|nr:hypothetical protein DAPPUDRAFT_114167 [Daphnia pulex]|eukprot:EFX68899.1 hypothetical protein DAPPUDRAFT_114167 [Daphnia pulex]